MTFDYENPRKPCPKAMQEFAANVCEALADHEARKSVVLAVDLGFVNDEVYHELLDLFRDAAARMGVDYDGDYDHWWAIVCCLDG